MASLAGYHVEMEMTAYHEAAHAVMALYNGVRVTKVRISKRAIGTGSTHYGPCQSIQPFETTPGNIKAIWLQTLAKHSARIRIALAGPLAEAKLLHTPLRSLGARSDLLRAQWHNNFLLNAHAYLSRYSQLPKGVPSDYLKQLRLHTRQLIAKPSHWHAITILADTLQRQYCIYEEELTACIQSAADCIEPSGMFGLFEN